MFSAIRFGVQPRKNHQNENTLIVAAHSRTPFVTLYSKSATQTAYATLPTPSALPTGNGRGCAVSRGGQYVAVVHEGNPYLSLYAQTQTGYEKLPNPSERPTGNGLGCAWRSDGEYLAVSHSTAPYITVYSRTGDVFTKLPTPAITPTGAGNGCAWSPDGTILAVAHTTAPFLTLYELSSGGLTKLDGPANPPTGTGWRCAWSPDGQYLVVGHDTVPRVTVYSRSGTTLTKQNDPASLPTSAATDVAWSPDGTLLAASHYSAPYVSLYTFAAGVLTRTTGPDVLPASNAYSCCFTNDGYFVVGSSTAPYWSIYTVADNLLTKIDNPTVMPTGTARGAAVGSSKLTPPPPPPPPPPPEEPLDGYLHFSFEEGPNPLGLPGPINGMRCNGNCPTISTDVSRSGSRSMKTYLNRLTSVVSYRTEATLHTPDKFKIDSHRGAATTAYWVGFSVMFKSPFPKERVYNDNTDFFNFHTDPPPGQGYPWYGNSQPLMLHFEPLSDTHGQFKIMVGGGGETGVTQGSKQTKYMFFTRAGSYQVDQWMDFVINIRFTPDEHGFVKIWLNGTKLVDVTGPVDHVGNGAPYPKLGLYTSWKDRNMDEPVVERTLYHDDFRIAWGPGANYNTVAPR